MKTDKTRFICHQNSPESLLSANDATKIPEPTRCGHCSIGGVIGIDQRSLAAAPFKDQIVSARQNFDIFRHTGWHKCQHFAIVNVVAAFRTGNRGWTKLTGVKAKFRIPRIDQQKLPL